MRRRGRHCSPSQWPARAVPIASTWCCKARAKPSSSRCDAMSVNPADSVLLGGLFGSDEMRAIFGERQFVQKMLDVEAALARVEARLGLIPDVAAPAITAAARVERLSLDELGASARLVGAPVVGLVKALGRAAGGEAERYVHWGATTQDIMDTA